MVPAFVYNVPASQHWQQRGAPCLSADRSSQLRIARSLDQLVLTCICLLRIA